MIRKAHFSVTITQKDVDSESMDEFENRMKLAIRIALGQIAPMLSQEGIAVFLDQLPSSVEIQDVQPEKAAANLPDATEKG